MRFFRNFGFSAKLRIIFRFLRACFIINVKAEAGSLFAKSYCKKLCLKFHTHRHFFRFRTGNWR